MKVESDADGNLIGDDNETETFLYLEECDDDDYEIASEYNGQGKFSSNFSFFFSFIDQNQSIFNPHQMKFDWKMGTETEMEMQTIQKIHSLVICAIENLKQSMIEMLTSRTISNQLTVRVVCVRLSVTVHLNII